MVMVLYTSTQRVERLHQFSATLESCYSDKLHDFSVITSRCYENLYASSFWAGVIFNFMLDKLLKQMEVIWLYCCIHPLKMLRDINLLLLWKAQLF